MQERKKKKESANYRHALHYNNFFALVPYSDAPRRVWATSVHSMPLSMCTPLKLVMCNLFDRIFNLHSSNLVWCEIKVQSLLDAHSMLLCDMYFGFHITSSIISQCNGISCDLRSIFAGQKMFIIINNNNKKYHKLIKAARDLTDSHRRHLTLFTSHHSCSLCHLLKTRSRHINLICDLTWWCREWMARTH